MKKYILLITVCVIYIALIIWKACGVTENEIFYQLIAYYIFPMSAALLAGSLVRKNKVNIITLLLIAVCQLLLPYLLFKAFAPGNVIFVIAAAAVGISVSIITSPKKHSI